MTNILTNINFDETLRQERVDDVHDGDDDDDDADDVHDDDDDDDDDDADTDDQVEDERSKYGPVPVSDKAQVVASFIMKTIIIIIDLISISIVIKAQVVSSFITYSFLPSAISIVILYQF